MLYALCSASADAAVRVGNASRSYAAGYQQVNAQREQIAAAAAAAATPTATTQSADTETNLPVRVANRELAQKLSRGETDSRVSIETLDSCAMVYPNGEFAWDTPTVGNGAGGASTCVAVVELRGYQMGLDGSDAVLARANLAAGDAVKCNISDFPEFSYTTDAAQVTFPADNEPTRADVVQVLNAEQKQNAGLRIAAGTVIGGLAGNAAGKNEIGSDSILGGGKHKTTGTIIGAISGAALMAGNAYSGKVAGDTILSTGVNAAAGSMIGNIAASGDSVLRIEDCKIPSVTVAKEKTTTNANADNKATTDATANNNANADDKTAEPQNKNSKCLWGVIRKGNTLGDKHAYYNTGDETTLVCESDDTGCKQETLLNIKLDAYPNKDIDAAAKEGFEKVKADSAKQFYLTEKNEMKNSVNPDNSAIYAKISSATIATGTQIPAMIADVNDKAFGYKRSDWAKLKSDLSGHTILGRTSSGTGYALDGEYSITDFYPMMVDASDGGIIDFGNKARLKGTLIGAGAGGALGAYAGYQGAQSDVENRWVTAVREYKDSLQKIYCATGKRFLGYYNDEIVIPTMINR
ncbi:MAG: hypothetical protein Q4E56_00270 [Pseudomonadota bacterium]|nr:hypothetical protein [Pseudomonadota bacterium]